MSVAQLVLGTARFGLDGYGFLAGVPKIAPEECERIVGTAWDCGVRWIETAEAYGDAEQLLGEIGVGKFRVVTKLHPQALEGTFDECDRIGINLLESRRRLHHELDGYLLHRSACAHSGQTMEALATACGVWGVALFGVACYTPEEAFAALAAGCTAISVPHNLFDLRAWNAGVFVEAERRGATVFARQPWCQGLLWRHRHEVESALAARLTQVGDDRVGRASTALVTALLTADHVVFGCDTVAQLIEDVREAGETRLGGAFPADVFGGVSAPLCNPSRFAQP